MEVVSEFKSADKSNDVPFVIRVPFVQNVKTFGLYFRNLGNFCIILEYFDRNTLFLFMVKTRKYHSKCSLRQKLNDLVSIVNLVPYRVNRKSIFILRKLALYASSS